MAKRTRDLSRSVRRAVHLSLPPIEKSGLVVDYGESRTSTRCSLKEALFAISSEVRGRPLDSLCLHFEEVDWNSSLGDGVNGVVRKCKKISTGETFALKVSDAGLVLRSCVFSPSWKIP
jgi:hypothetical protein